MTIKNLFSLSLKRPRPRSSIYWHVDLFGRGITVNSRGLILAHRNAYTAVIRRGKVRK